MALNVQNDVHCCGITHIGMFGHGESHITDIKTHKTANRCVLATVNDQQKEAKKALEKEGFELLKEFKGNSGHQVYLYGYFKR